MRPQLIRPISSFPFKNLPPHSHSASPLPGRPTFAFHAKGTRTVVEFIMSCNGCRVLRKGCSDSCVLRPCLQWIQTAEAQAHATVFLAKFFGRAGLMSFISAVPHSQRPALFQSLLFEACGRTVNPVNGAVGLLWTGNWHVCQEAVETVLRGGSPRAMPDLMAPTPASEATCTDMWKLREETSANLNSRSKVSVSVSPKRKRVEEFKKLQPSDLDLCLTASFTGKRAADDRRPGTPSMNSEDSVTTACFEFAFTDQQGADKKLLNLFL